MAIKYSNHFLNQVIFQANYNVPVIKTEINASLKNLCEEITGQSLYIGKNTNINVAADQPVLSTVQNRYLFLGKEVQVVVQGDFVQVINLKYTDYTHFHGIIEKVFNKVREVYNPGFSRIALRYTNNINFPDGSTFDFDGLIDESFLNCLLKFKDQGLARSVGQTFMTHEDGDLSTLFTYGFSNSQFPGKIIKREFLLDFDCYRTYQEPNFNINSISEITLSIRNKVNELFEKSIGEKLRTLMHEEKII